MHGGGGGQITNEDCKCRPGPLYEKISRVVEETVLMFSMLGKLASLNAINFKHAFLVDKGDFLEDERRRGGGRKEGARGERGRERQEREGEGGQVGPKSLTGRLRSHSRILKQTGTDYGKQGLKIPCVSVQIRPCSTDTEVEL